jgi:septum formation protein
MTETSPSDAGSDDLPVLRGPLAVEIVLASASPSRRMLLAQAGVAVTADAAHVDETEVKASLRADGATAAQAAETLAELKAQHVSRRHRGALVIGADQILDCDGEWFDKPADRAQAAAHLRALAGRRHVLATSVCVVRDGTVLWHHTAAAGLEMRPLGDAFIERYLEAAGDAVLASVGAYQIEGLGVHLFARIDGEFFTILGLPLLPLLAFLREHGAVPQ